MTAHTTRRHEREAPPAPALGVDGPGYRAFGLWGGMLVWLFSLVAVWGISEIDAYTEVFSGTLLGLPSATLISLALILLCALTALSAGMVALANQPQRSDDPEDEAPFIVRFGVLINGLFTIAILAHTLPFFLLSR